MALQEHMHNSNGHAGFLVPCFPVSNLAAATAVKSSPTTRTGLEGFIIGSFRGAVSAFLARTT